MFICMNMKSAKHNMDGNENGKRLAMQMMTKHLPGRPA